MLPLQLQNGMVAIYGLGSISSPNGLAIINQRSEVRFGYVSHVYAGGAVFVYNGDAVMFKESDVYERVSYNGYPYTLVPVSLVTKEAPLA